MENVEWKEMAVHKEADGEGGKGSTTLGRTSGSVEGGIS